MSIIANNLLQGDEGYNIARSLRFRSSASAYLNRTPASAGNRKTWTYSTWIKRGQLGVRQSLLYCVTGTTDSTFLILGFDASERFEVSGYITQFRTSTAVYRDPSAWYHVVVAFDSTQATASNRLRVYINNTEITAWTTNNAFTQNTDYGINQNTNHQIGGGGYLPFDGYLTEVNFIDGQALTPSSFGETDLVTGVWKAKKYAGTYGTNGFYLPFTDVATTSGSNAGLGKDFSGNGNYWNTNNISVTAGSTYDSMTDVPTLTSATASNFAVANPLDKQSDISVAQGNLYFSTTAGAGNKQIRGTIALPSSGKFYWETKNTGSTNNFSMGVGDMTSSLSSEGAGEVIYNEGGNIINNGSSNGGYSTLALNDVVGVAVDIDANKIYWYKNNTLVNSGGTTINISAPFAPIFGLYTNGNAQNVNFGQQPFAYTPPTGFVALNTYNLPTPVIGSTASTLASKNFDATTYTGNGSTQTVVNAGGFQPDLVWGKRRDAAGNNNLFDRLRGVTNYLTSNGVGAEISGVSGVSAFNSNGFSVGSHPDMNTSGGTFVGWQWKANGSAVSNTAGSITSQVSANPTAGFSVVTYTGTGANATVGHGLGVAPSMMIVKSRSQPQSWVVWFKGFTGTEYLLLNATSAKGSAASIWNSTVPTSIVFSIGTDVSVNISGATQVAYCFSAVSGYSAMGSYTGNSSADGTFVATGFRPKFVMLKRTDTAGYDWFVLDSARNTYNATSNYLYPDLSNAEGSSFTVCDFLSNGFKFRDNRADWNGSGATYIYYAVAENPFKYSLGR